LSLDSEAAHRALRATGDLLELGVSETAQGVLEVVDALMERAIRRVTIEQGADPRQAALLAFGGAGGLHASSLARRIGMPAVLIPPHAGVFSALGLLLSPPRFDVVRTALMNEGDGRLDVVLKSLLAEASESYRTAMGGAPRRTEARADLRYRGQSHETTVSIALGEGWEPLTRRFHQAHLKANGFSRPDEPVELVTFRAVAIDDPRLRWADIPVRPPQGKPELPDRPMPDGGMAARRWRPALTPGAEVIGPAAIEEPEATTWIGQGERAQVLEDGTLEITW
jgi:N-methylhydantoinase A